MSDELKECREAFDHFIGEHYGQFDRLPGDWELWQAAWGHTNCSCDKPGQSAMIATEYAPIEDYKDAQRRAARFAELVEDKDARIAELGAELETAKQINTNWGYQYAQLKSDRDALMAMLEKEHEAIVSEFQNWDSHVQGMAKGDECEVCQLIASIKARHSESKETH